MFGVRISASPCFSFSLSRSLPPPLPLSLSPDEIVRTFFNMVSCPLRNHEAGPPDHLNDKVDSDQYVVNKVLSLHRSVDNGHLILGSNDSVCMGTALRGGYGLSDP